MIEYFKEAIIYKILIINYGEEIGKSFSHN